LCSLFGRYNISTARSRISHLRGGTAAALVHCNVVVTVLKILGSYCTSLDKVLRHSIGSHLAPNSYYNGHLLSGSLCCLESCSFGTIGARDRTQVTPKLTTVTIPRRFVEIKYEPLKNLVLIPTYPLYRRLNHHGSRNSYQPYHGG